MVRESMYSEAESELKWRRHAKGRGLRWLIQREMVAILSRKPLTTTGVQDVMLMMRGISHKKTTELLEELKQAGALEEFKEPDKGYYWRTTELGVIAYLVKRTAIPAKVAEELLMLANAIELGR